MIRQKLNAGRRRPARRPGSGGASCRRTLAALLCLGGLACAGGDDGGVDAGGTGDPAPLNVLFLIIDDLRPTLGCYGDVAITPHMDALAARGTLFGSAFCQQSLCNPSRTSVLTGYRPLRTGVSIQKTENNAQRQRFRPALREIITLPQHFKNAGYRTLALGKVHHGYGNLDDKPSWSAKCWRPPFEFYHSGQWNDRETERAPAWEAPDVDDHVTMDGKIAARATELLEEMRDEPFFLAVGFHKPHLPFVAPKRYWDLYDGDTFPAAPSRSAPENAPDCAVADRRELRGFAGIPDEGPLPEATARRLRQGYYACTSYADALVGEVLETLDRLELTERTIVCLWGDHGYHLGDNSLWAKQTNFEVAMRVPLIISAPGSLPRGTRTDGLVELVDLFPTLCELAGLAVPQAPEDVGGLEGVSLVPLMEKPARPWKEAVFGRVGVDNPDPAAGPMQGVGVTVRDERYRLVEWRLPWRSGQPHHYELYDLDLDPHATRNLAYDKASRGALQHMRSLQRTGWRGIRRSLLAEKQ